MKILLQCGGPILAPGVQDFTVRTALAPVEGTGLQLRIISVRGDFVTWFFPKQEAGTSSKMLSCFELQDNASTSAIVAELGGLQAAETSLGVLYSLLLRQPTGQEGPLAINGWGNLFFARDAQNVLRSVNVHWCDDGWSLEALKLETTVDWPIRDRVFRYATQ